MWRGKTKHAYICCFICREIRMTVDTPFLFVIKKTFVFLIVFQWMQIRTIRWQYKDEIRGWRLCYLQKLVINTHPKTHNPFKSTLIEFSERQKYPKCSIWSMSRRSAFVTENSVKMHVLKVEINTSFAKRSRMPVKGPENVLYSIAQSSRTSDNCTYRNVSGSIFAAIIPISI